VPVAFPAADGPLTGRCVPVRAESVRDGVIVASIEPDLRRRIPLPHFLKN
jgi:hypothetical protein